MVPFAAPWIGFGVLGLPCTSLQQAAPLTFGLPLPFREMTNWEVTVNEQAIDIGEVSKQHYSGGPPEDALPVALTGSAEWASWVFSLAEVWQDDAPMQDRPLEVHCSGLGGGLLSGEHEYDIFLQNLAQTKVYGPSLAMTDDWEEHITQLGLTKTVHEYVIYQLLSTAEGWTAWRDFLPGQFADQQLLLTRAIRLIEAANIRPAHARPPHPTWTTAITGEAHFCAPAFSYVLRTKTGTFFVTLFSPISIALRPSRPASRPASKLAPKCFVLIPMVSRRWSSRLALRPASNYTSSSKLFVWLQFPYP